MEKAADKKMDEKIRMESIGELDPVIREIYNLGEPQTLEEGKKIYSLLMNTVFAKKIIKEENQKKDVSVSPAEVESNVEEKSIEVEAKTEEPVPAPVEEKQPEKSDKPKEEIKVPDKPEPKKGIAFPKKNSQPKEQKHEEDSSDDYFDVSKKPHSMANPMISNANPFR